MSLGAILLLSAVGLLLILAGSSVYFSWLMNKAVYSKLRDLNEIRTTQLPPASWQKSMLKKGKKSGSIGEADRSRQLKKDLKRLDGIVRFTQKTKMVEDEETRQLVLRELSQIRQMWADE